MSIFGFKLKQNILGKPGLCAVQLSPQGISGAYVDRKAGMPVLECCDFIDCDLQTENIIPALSQIVKKNKLDNIRCSWILSPGDYSLLPLGVLPVNPAEILQAVRFQIKDRIDFPLEKACITYFTAPHIHQSLKEEFVYAVAAKKDFLEKTAQIIRAGGLNLSIIDIPEFALRNTVACLYAIENASEKNSIGLLDITPSKTTLIIMQKGIIQLIRQINFEGKNVSAQSLDKLCAELQRSLDYYENELGQNAVGRFYLSPGCLIPELLPELKDQLNCEIEAVQLDKFFNFPLEQAKEKILRCFAVIGGALRDESHYAAAN